MTWRGSIRGSGSIRFRGSISGSGSMRNRRSKRVGAGPSSVAGVPRPGPVSAMASRSSRTS